MDDCRINSVLSASMNVALNGMLESIGVSMAGDLCHNILVDAKLHR